MNDMRMAKFETLIEDINASIQHSTAKIYKLKGLLFPDIGHSLLFSKPLSGITALALIFDYNKCNEYAKVIMDSASLYLNVADDKDDKDAKDFWMQTFKNYESFQNAKNRLDGTKKFVQLCRKFMNDVEKYKFIFWALMILTVDKTDAENHLALICDFAKMLYITEEEFEDIIQTVKLIYNELPKEYLFKSETIPNYLSSLFCLYGRGDMVAEYL